MNLNRKFVSIEMDEIWYDYAVNRLEYRTEETKSNGTTKLSGEENGN